MRNRSVLNRAVRNTAIWRRFTYLPGKYFTVYKITANNKKHWLYFFLPKPSLGTHTGHGLSSRLRTPLSVLIVYYFPVRLRAYEKPFSIIPKIILVNQNQENIKNSRHGKIAGKKIGPIFPVVKTLTCLRPMFSQRHQSSFHSKSTDWFL